MNHHRPGGDQPSHVKEALVKPNNNSLPPTASTTDLSPHHPIQVENFMESIAATALANTQPSAASDVANGGPSAADSPAYQGPFSSIEQLNQAIKLNLPLSDTDDSNSHQNYPLPLPIFQWAWRQRQQQHQQNQRGLIKRIYLCRHGETEPNKMRVLQGSGLNESLNENGLQQAKQLAKRFQGLPVDLLVASDLKVNQIHMNHG